jgi:hypothetical protein
MVMSPAGLGSKNDCADGGQQQFTRTDPTEIRYPVIEYRSSKWAQLSRGLPPPHLRKETNQVP